MAKRRAHEHHRQGGRTDAEPAGGDGAPLDEGEPRRAPTPTLERIDANRWMIPRSSRPDMLVDGIVYATPKLMESGVEDGALLQVANVACLPGIVVASFAMPDIHFGYGFAIGGVAAMSVSDGVVSPGGVGYDINCGVRLVRSDLHISDVSNRIDLLLSECFRSVPAGVGGGGGVSLNETAFNDVCRKGAAWAVARGHGREADLDRTEARGCLPGADPDAVSARARSRGVDQLGTLGSGNHFLELQVVDKVLDADAAHAFGIDDEGQVTVMIHCGSRGFGHQVCDDHIALMQRAVTKYGIRIPDRQLGCAPVTSPEGEHYLAAMACAANYAWANRQVILQRVRGAFERVLGVGEGKLGLRQVYDVAHNIAKLETHVVDGVDTPLCVHRKGATRAFPPGHPEVPSAYAAVGQPVLVPGDMGSPSYVLAGTEKAYRETFGSTCHGAGRALSRSRAKQLRSGREVIDDLAARGILVKAKSPHAAAEEQPDAYKDIDEVVAAVVQAGLARPVVKLRPLAVMKG